MADTDTTATPVSVRAQHRYARFSASKAREVLDLIRGKPVGEARSILQFCERAAAEPIAKVLDSAVANAANNRDIPPEELYVATCFADEGPTLKRWRPRARGRATRIRKRTCHVTVVVERLTVAELDRLRERAARSGRGTRDASTDRARRVARSKSRGGEPAPAGDEELDPRTEELEDAEAAASVVGETYAETAEADTDGADVEVAEDVAAQAEALAEDAEADAADTTPTDAVDTDGNDAEDAADDAAAKKDED
jgi:large subunit ribosomal protein L22